MKFVTFLKIFAICFFSLIGTFAAGFGVMHLAGAFTEPEIKPQDVSFEQTEYNVTGDEFTVKVTTKTENVTLDKLELSLVNGEKTERNTITDNVIEIPTTAKIGEDIKVKICKNIHELIYKGKTTLEDVYKDWTKGGHSTIIAKSTNIIIEPAKTKINVDVPVYKIDVETKASLDSQDTYTNFVKDSSIYANLKFYPERSAYQYSNDGGVGANNQKILKNAYFVSLSTTDSLIEQVDSTNEFRAIKVGQGAEIKGYVFTTTKVEQNVLEWCKDENGNIKLDEVLYNLNSMVNDDSVEVKSALASTTKVNIVDIDVDKMEVNGRIKDVVVDKESYLYVAKTLTNQDSNSSNLDILLSSTKDSTVSLQAKLKNVALSFKIKKGGNLHDAVDNLDQTYNVIKFADNGYSRKFVVEDKENGNEYYYFPVVTSNINNSYWKFSVNQLCDPDSLVANFVYVKDGKITEMQQQKTFSTRNIGSEEISWKNTFESVGGIKLKIYDHEKPENVQYEEFDLAKNTNIPATNIYKTTKYFAYQTGMNENRVKDLTQIIHCEPAVKYTLGQEEYDLYEIPDGIVKAKSSVAHNKSFKVMYMTVRTDANGQVKLVEGKYDIDQYSRNNLGLSSIDFYITKTLQNISASLNPNADNTIYPEGKDMLAYVQGTLNAFDVIVKPSKSNELENGIFKQAIESGMINVVAMVGDVETPIIEKSTEHPEQENLPDAVAYKFAMKVGSLPLQSQSMIVNMYIKYQKSSTVTEYYKINNYEKPKDKMIASLQDGIEVYDGAAQIFSFGITQAEELQGNKNTPENRIVVTSKLIKQTGITAVNYVSKIETTYTLGAENFDVSNLLFDSKLEDGNNEVIDYTKIKILLKDKYGRQPLFTQSKLRSSNQRVLVVNGTAINFVGSGNVELELLDGSDNVKDRIYFNSTQAGRVSSVRKFQQTVLNGDPTLSSVEIYNYEDNNLPYEFKPIVIKVIGHSGLTMFFNSTIINNKQGKAQAGNLSAVNIISFIYSCEELVEINGREEMRNVKYDLTGHIKYSWPEELAERYKGYISFGEGTGADSISFIKDFGQKTTFNILAEIPELGISQIITIDVEPNIILSVTPIFNSSVGIVDVNRYDGIYANSNVKITGSIQVLVKSANTPEFGFFIKEKTALQNEEYVRVDKESSPLKVVEGDVIFKRPTESLRIEIDITVKFDECSDFTKYDLIFKPTDTLQENKDYNAFYMNYIYLNPNVKIDETSSFYNDVLYLQVAQKGAFGDINLPKYINLNKIEKDTVENQEANKLTGKVKYVLHEDYKKQFSLNEETGVLTCIVNNITGITTVKVAVYYQGYNVREGAELLSDGKYYITLKVAPNVIPKLDGNMFVLYGGEYYLKFVNGIDYTYAQNINTAFASLNEDGEEVSITNLDHINIQFSKSEYEGQSQSGESGFKIQNVDYKIVTDSTCTVRLTNGHNVTFKVILLPGEVPFVNYANNDLTVDLKDSLDEDYLWANKENISFNIDEIGSEKGKQIFFKEFSTDQNSPTYGIKWLSSDDGGNSQYNVKNEILDDITCAKFIGDTYSTIRLKTIPLGTDKYVMVNYKLADTKDSLIIPYLIKIAGELKLQAYYPYLNNGIDNIYNPVDTDGSKLFVRIDLNKNKPDLDMEYLSFDNSAEPKAVLNLNDKLSSFSPNYKNSLDNAEGKEPINIWNSGKRLKVVKNSNGKIEDLTQVINPISFDYKITRLVTFDDIGFYPQTAIDAFATIKDGILTIRKNRGYRYLRLEIEVTSINGIKGYYYVSCGEVPEFKVTYNNGSMITDQIPNETIASGTTNNLLSRYKLELASTNMTKLLQFYSPNYLIIENGNITVEKTVEDLQTNLVLYTKFGELKNVNVKIESTYKLESYESEVFSGRKGLDLKELITIRGCESSKWNITSVSTVEEKPTWIKINNNTVDIGLVDVDTKVQFKVVTDLESETTKGKFFTFTYTLNIKSNLEVINGKALTDPYRYENEVVSQKDFSLELNKLFKFKNEKDTLDTLVSNEIGKFVCEIITNGNAVTLPQDKITNTLTLKTKLITEPVVVTLKISYVNYDLDKGSETLSNISWDSYVVFTITPSVKISVNYLKAQKNAPESTKEKFYAGEGENLIGFNLSDIPYLGNLERVAINSKTTTTVYVNPIYDTNAVEIVGKPTGDINWDFTFTFKLLSGNTNSEIIFKFYIKQGQEVIYFSMVYILDVYSNINSVYSVVANNLTSLNKENTQSNPELIYVGDNDKNMFTVMKVEYTLRDKISEKKYGKIKLGDTDVLMLSEIVFDTLDFNTTGKTAIFKVEGTFNSNAKFKIEVYDDPEFKVLSKDLEGNGVDVEITNVTTRLELYYNIWENQKDNKVDFEVAYNNLLSQVTWSNDSLKGEITNEPVVVDVAISVSEKSIKLTNYYIDYQFDVNFTRNKLEIENNQKISIVNDDPQYHNDNLYRENYGMHKISNGKAYDKNEMAKVSFDIEIADITNVLPDDISSKNTKIGFVTYEPYFVELSKEKAGGEQKNKVYDFLFIAHGAPNKPVTVLITVKVKSNELFKQFVLTLVVSHDYKTISLRNFGGDPNTSVNPLKIDGSLFNEHKSDLLLTLAKYNNLEINKDLIFILHENNKVMNAASRFHINILDGGDYATTVNNEQDLVLLIKKAEFGNRYITIELNDGYLFKLKYYIEITAPLSPSYDGRQLTGYETDKLNVVAEGQGGKDNSVVNIQILGISSTELKNVTKDYRLEFFDNNLGKFVYDAKCDIVNGNILPTLPTSMFKDSATSLKARIILTLTKNSESCEIIVPLNFVQRYTIKSKEDEKFIRDGKDFSLLDVVSFHDNKAGIAYGDRKLEDVTSLYIKPIIDNTTVDRKGYIDSKLVLAIKNAGSGGTQNKSLHPFEDGYFDNSLCAKYKILEDIQGGNLDTSRYQYYLGSLEGGTVQYFTLEDNSIDEAPITFKSQIFKLEHNDKVYKFEVYLVKDQKFTINTRKVEKDNIVQVLFANDRVKAITLDENLTKSYSLLQEGIIVNGTRTEFFYGKVGEKLYINGLYTGDLQKILNITFKDDNGKDLNGTDSIKLNGEIDREDPIRNIKYHSQTKEYTVEYPGVGEGGVVLNIDYKVTPLYIGVNTLQAYGASNSKTLYVPNNSVDLSTNKIKADTIITAINWAGDSTNQTALKLYKSYNSVAQIEPNEDLYFVDGIALKNSLKIELNATSSNAQYIALEGGDLTFKQGFNLLNNHVMIDVYCTYEVNKEVYKIKIGSVVFKLEVLNKSDYSVDYKNSINKKLYVQQNPDNTTYSLSKNDILDALLVRTTNGLYYSGSDLERILNLNIYYKLDQASNFVSLGNADSITIDDNNKKISIKIKADGQQDIDGTQDDLTFNFTTQKYIGIMVGNDIDFSYSQLSNDSIFDEWLKKRISQKVKFVDNYNNLHNLAEENINISSQKNKVGDIYVDVLNDSSEKFISNMQVSLSYCYKENESIELGKLNVKKYNQLEDITVGVNINSDANAVIDQDTWQKTVNYSGLELNLNNTYICKLPTVKTETKPTEGTPTTQAVTEKVGETKTTKTDSYTFDISSILSYGNIDSGSITVKNAASGVKLEENIVDKSIILKHTYNTDTAPIIFNDIDRFLIMTFTVSGEAHNILIYNPEYINEDKWNDLASGYLCNIEMKGEYIKVNNLSNFLSCLTFEQQSKFMFKASGNIGVNYDNNKNCSLVINKCNINPLGTIDIIYDNKVIVGQIKVTKNVVQ